MSPRLFLLPAMAVLLAACNKPSDPVLPPQPRPETSATTIIPRAEAAPLVGGDSDAHGCKASAGYTWSQLQEKCLRLFESARRMDALATAAPAAGAAAYVVFDRSEARAEVFLPGEKASLILELRGVEGEQAWEGGAYRLLPWKGYVLQKNGQAVYAGE